MFTKVINVSLAIKTIIEKKVIYHIKCQEPELSDSVIKQDMYNITACFAQSFQLVKT